MNSYLFAYNDLFDDALKMSENQILNIVIENRESYRKLIEDLLHKKAGEDRGVFISENLEEISFKNIDIISDLFSISLNGKNLLNALLNKIDKLVFDEAFSIDAMKISSQLENLFINISDNLDYEIEFSNVISFKDLAKVSDVRFEEKSLSFLETIMKYVQASSDLLNTKLFIFLNLKAYFSKEEIDFLYEFFIYNKIPVIIIQSEIYFKNDNENLIIVDNDLCCI